MSTDYSQHLRELINCRTISDPEFFSQQEFDKLNSVLLKNYPVTMEKAEHINNGNSTFIRIPGKDSENPIVLMSHKDVVHEGKKKWKSDPFEGNIINGKMYGRGTFDCKASLCCIFEALESVLSEGYEFSRDIYVLSTSNEETGGTDAPDAVEYFKSKNIVPWLVLDEGGATLSNPFPSKYKRFAMVGAVERSSSRMIFDLDSEKSAKDFVKKIKKLRPGKYEITPEVSELLEGLGNYLSFPLGNIIRCLNRHPKAAASIMTKCGPDARSFCGVLTGYTKLSEKSIQDLKSSNPELKNPVKIFISGNYYNKIDTVTEDVLRYSESLGAKLFSTEMREADDPVSTDSEGYLLMKKLAKKVFDKAGILPYPVLGRTDARYFVGYAKNVIRYLPVEISLLQMTKFHCPNENIYVDSLPKAIEFYKEVIKC